MHLLQVRMNRLIVSFALRKQGMVRTHKTQTVQFSSRTRFDNKSAALLPRTVPLLSPATLPDCTVQCHILNPSLETKLSFHLLQSITKFEQMFETCMNLRQFGRFPMVRACCRRFRVGGGFF